MLHVREGDEAESVGAARTVGEIVHAEVQARIERARPMVVAGNAAREAAPARRRSRQRSRIYHRACTILYAWRHRGYQVREITLTSQAGCAPERMAAHLRKLLDRVARRLGFEGVEYLVVRTNEGQNVPAESRGVMHVLVGWRPAEGKPHKYFFIDQGWLSVQWLEIHGAPIVWIKTHRQSEGTAARAAAYLASQYLAGQDALERYSWSWRRTFGGPVVRLWTAFRRAHGWSAPMRDVIAGWHRVLEGGTVEVGGTAFALPGAT